MAASRAFFLACSKTCWLITLAWDDGWFEWDLASKVYFLRYEVTETSVLTPTLDCTSYPSACLALSPATKLLNIFRLIWTNRGVNGLDDLAESRGALPGIWVFFMDVGTFWPAVFFPASLVFDLVDVTSSRGPLVSLPLLLVEIYAFYSSRFSELWDIAFSPLAWF